MFVLRPAPIRRSMGAAGVCLAILLVTASFQHTGLADHPPDDTGDIASPASPGVDDPFYPDLGDVLDELQDLAADHPAIVDYQDIGNATHTSRDIVALKISDNVDTDEDEPVWAFAGIIHGSEQLGLRVLLDLAEELADDCGADSDVTDWVDAYEIWVVLLLNP